MKSINIWSCLYIIFILIITVTFEGMSFLLFVIYTVLAIPFIKHVDKFLCIVFSTSLISYYFIGGDEAVISLYTIFMGLVILSLFFTKRELNTKKISYNIYLKIFLCLIGFLSYNNSPFKYLKGFWGLVYIVLLSIVISIFVKIDDDTINILLPNISCILIIFFLLKIFIDPVVSYGRFTIDASVNQNTFGMALAQLTTIVIIKALLNRKNKSKNIRYMFMFTIGVFLLFLSGSRSALLATAVSFLITLFIYTTKNKNFSRMIIILLIIIGLSTVVMNTIVGNLGISLSRFSYQNIYSTGGTNRTLIWKTIIPYVYNNYFLVGYGPGHNCTRLVINILLNRDYAHSHNLILESFCELGIIGITITILLVLTSLKELYKKSMTEDTDFIILGIFLCLLVNGLGESYFCDAIFWIIIGISTATRINNKIIKEI